MYIVRSRLSSKNSFCEDALPCSYLIFPSRIALFAAVDTTHLSVLNTALARRAVIAARHAGGTLFSTNWAALEKAAVRTADGALRALAASTLTSLELKIAGLARGLAPEDTSHFAVREAYLAVRAVAANSPTADAGSGG